MWGDSGERVVRGDFDGDGRADVAFVRTSDLTWTIFPSSNTAPRNFPNSVYPASVGQVGTHFTFGLAGDKPTPADFDGDGKTDLAYWRAAKNGQPGRLFVAPSSGVCPWDFTLQGWASAGGVYCAKTVALSNDILTFADYDGDRIDDASYIRESTVRWDVLPSTGLPPPLNPTSAGITPEGQLIVEYPWDQVGAIPVPARISVQFLPLADENIKLRGFLGNALCR